MQRKFGAGEAFEDFLSHLVPIMGNMEVPFDLRETAARWPDLKRWERQELAQDLRRFGLSYREIRAIIPVASGTLSGWCRDIPLTLEQQDRLKSIGGNGTLGRAKAGAVLRKRNVDRVAAIRAAARKEAEGLIDDPFWVAGVVAYWAEGDKRSQDVKFSNSNSQLIVLFIEWSIAYLQVTRARFTIALHLHGGQEEGERKIFWSQLTGIGLNQFRKTFHKPEGTGHRKNILYGGTAAIRVTRSTDLLHRLLGWIDAVSDHYSSDRLSSGPLAQPGRAIDS